MMNEMMDNCCGGMGIFMWIGMLLLVVLLILLIIWLFKQIKK
jgi:flagellar biogenesis protein FliO